MFKRGLLCLTAAGALSVGSLVIEGAAQSKDAQKVPIPQPGVPQIMTMDGRYVRAAYNNEGYVVLGYKLANLSVGEDWLLLEVGVTLRKNAPDYDLTREAVTLETPSGTTLSLPTVAEYRKANLSALQARERVQRDSINYFPPNADQACSLQFFTDLENRPMSWDKVELTNRRACLGRLYFQVPGGIKYGQHWLNVKFANSLVRVPFRILTKEEDELLEKHYPDFKKQVDAAFKKKKN
jgi:hypothetical protein